MVLALANMLLTALSAVTIYVILLRVLFRLPSLAGRKHSTALAAPDASPLARQILPLSEHRHDQSGILPLVDGADAYCARMLLARAATLSIDAQYYIWQHDLTGLPLLAELRAAAERGVRVRLLVDDNGTPALDRELAALNSLPNAEVRIFNPFNLRRPRRLSYTFDFFRLNRRMHNKSFTVDGVATIIGGRNIGDIYFARDAEAQYSDLDLLAVGKVVGDVARDFDRYWNSQSAYPHDLLVSPPAEGFAAFDAGLKAALADPGTRDYADAIRASGLMQDIAAGSLPFLWADAQLVSDDPAKGLGEVRRKHLMLVQLVSIAGSIQHSLDLISAYFVPGRRGVRVLRNAVASGARIRTLTNSLEATDVLPVHASYTKYRRKLLEAGVEVYELKADGAPPTESDKPLFGKSASSLHAKTLILDRQKVFVGSFNFDPRSVLLNCEMGVLVDSPELADRLTRSFEEMFRQAAWRVRYGRMRRLVWEDAAGRRSTREPGASLLNTAALTVIGWLPVEWLM